MLTAVAACVLSLTIKVAATVAATEQGRASQAFEVEGLQIWTMTPDVLILFGQSIKNIEIKRHCHCNIGWNFKSIVRELYANMLEGMYNIMENLSLSKAGGHSPETVSHTLTTTLAV